MVEPIKPGLLDRDDPEAVAADEIGFPMRNERTVERARAWTAGRHDDAFEYDLPGSVGHGYPLSRHRIAGISWVPNHRTPSAHPYRSQLKPASDPLRWSRRIDAPVFGGRRLAD